MKIWEKFNKVIIMGSRVEIILRRLTPPTEAEEGFDGDEPAGTPVGVPVYGDHGGGLGDYHGGNGGSDVYNGI